MKRASALLMILGGPILLNSIRNGGFETGDLSSWSTTSAFDGEVTSAEAHSGTYSLRMDAVDSVSQSLFLKPKVQELRFWAKADVPITTGPAYATLYFTDGTSRSKSFGGGALASGDWTNFKLAVFMSKAVEKVEFSVGESTSIYIDDVSMSSSVRF